MKLKQQRVGLYTCYIHFFGVKSLEHLAWQNGYKDNINIDMQAAMIIYIYIYRSAGR